LFLVARGFEKVGEAVDYEIDLLDFYVPKWLQQPSRWRRLLKRADLAEKKRRFHVLRMYTLRKYFRTRLESANLPTGFIERMMGHKPHLDQAYFKPTEEELADRYSSAVPELLLSGPTQSAGRQSDEQSVTVPS